MNPLKQLKQFHAYTITTGIDHTKTLITKLLQIPDIPYAHKLFENIPHPSTFHYNKLIQAYSYHGPYHQCFILYTQMSRNAVSSNPYSFTFLLSACASLSSHVLGNMLHARFVKSGIECDVYASTALVDMYAKLGLLVEARKWFDEMANKDVPAWNAVIAGYARGGKMEAAFELFSAMPVKNVVSWTSMVSGHAQNGRYSESLAMFLEMEKERTVLPNQVTIASVLPACANLGALEIGERIEAFARQNNYFKNLFVCNALIEMYARCGKIDTAKRLFDEIGGRRNLCSWNSMIMGFAVHGSCLEGLELFNQMLRNGVAPDDITFVGVLLACTHGGMVARGREIFESMDKDFSIRPKLEHYGCMVDLLGRAGKLRDAYELIKSMPMKPDAVLWGTLLGACSFYGNVEFAEIAAEHLFKLEPWNPGNYVILSNIYASAGLMEGVARVRKLMKGGRITKAAGYSCVEEGGQVHKFIVEDRSHPRSDEIYETLSEISSKMMKPGPNVDDDDDDEVTLESVDLHAS